MTDSSFPYGLFPLQPHSEEIRLLLLQPGQWDERISCKFKIISLKDSHPTYEALSYVWGDERNREEINLEGWSARVTDSLFKALRRLRRPRDIRTIWVDALCINQSDVEEKSAQVALMGEIYKRTAEVYIWLADYTHELGTPRDTRTIEETNDLPWYDQPGPNEGELDGGFGAMAVVWELAASTSRHLDQIPLFIKGPGGLKIASRSAEKALQAFMFLMTAPWWRRIWVIQETVLPPKATVIVGSIKMLWEVFALAATNMEIHSKCCDKLILTLPGLCPAIEQFIIYVKEIAYTRMKRRVDSRSQDLHDLLWQYRCHRATDPRDMVFALLSFVGDPEAYVELKPNYSLSTREVYKRATIYSMRSSKKLSILRGQRRQSSSMPSWIYDWSLPMNEREWHIERQTLRHGNYKASGEEDVSFSCGENYELELKGIFVDKVIAVGPAVERSDYRDIALMISIWRHLAGLPGRDNEPYIGGGDLRSGFWRTVTRDLSFGEDFELQRVRDNKNHVSSASAWWTHVTDEWPNPNPPAASAAETFKKLVGNVLFRQKFFLTKGGYMGMGNPEPGDDVFVLLGGAVPFILRSTLEGKAYLVGDCYVHGIMDGEVLERERQTVILQ